MARERKLRVAKKDTIVLCISIVHIKMKMWHMLTAGLRLDKWKCVQCRWLFLMIIQTISSVVYWKFIFT